MKPARANPVPVDSAAAVVVATVSAEAAVMAVVVADVPAAVAGVVVGPHDANHVGNASW